MQQPTNIPDDKKGEEKAVDEVNTGYNWGGTVCKNTHSESELDLRDVIRHSGNFNVPLIKLSVGT